MKAKAKQNKSANKFAANKTTANKTAVAKKTAGKSAMEKPAPKRPSVNPPMPNLTIEKLINDFTNIRSELENYAAHLRALDRKRLNGVGIKTLGFIDRSHEYAAENPEFLPYYLSLEKYTEDHDYFIGFHTLLDIDKQIQELLWNITLQAADMVYTDSLEFYSSVREAARRRVDASESIYKDLSLFFRKYRKAQDKPTAKEIIRDANAILRGKRNGKIALENIKPKLTGGAHKVVDERFEDSEQFKETAQGETGGLTFKG